MKNRPPIAIRSSGISLATVATEFRRAPTLTPCMFTMDQKIKATATSAPSLTGPPSDGTRRPTFAANSVATAAAAKVPSIHRSTPEMNPA